MEVLEGNYHILHIDLPVWMFYLSLDEWRDIMKVCDKAAKDAFYKKLDNIERIRSMNNNTELEGQTSIYDYV